MPNINCCVIIRELNNRCDRSSCNPEITVNICNKLSVRLKEKPQFLLLPIHSTIIFFVPKRTSLLNTLKI